MATKLRLLSLARPSALPLKTLIFIGLAAFAKLNGSILGYAVFLVGSILVYFFPLSKVFSYFFTGITLIILTLIGLVIIPGTLFWVFLLFLSSLWYILLNVRNLEFIRRSLWQYSVLISTIYLGSLFASKLIMVESPDIRTSAAIFILSTAIFREFFINSSEDSQELSQKNSKKDKTLFSAISGLIIAESFWTTTILPISPVYAASIIAGISFFLADYFKNNKNASGKYIAVNLAILVFIIAISLLASKWSISG